MELGPVGDHQRDGVAARDAELREPAGQRVHAVAQLRPRPADVIVASAHGDAVAVLGGGDPEGLGDGGRHGLGTYRNPKPSPVSRPRSFVNPITNSPITSANPIMPARSITANGIALPRTFSASAQKMWPPSSGRNGNRFTMPSESEMTASRISASVAE